MTGARDAGGATTEAGGPWRVGRHYDLHLYEGDRPVATFHRAEDAARTVAVVNAALALRPAQPEADALREEVEAARQWCASVQSELESRASALRESQAALSAARERQAASDRALAGRDRLIATLRADLANAAGGMAEHTCEGCGAPLMVDEDAATTTDVVGCWPYVTGENRYGRCWRYRTADGADRAWPACALAADPGPRTAGASTGGDGHG